MSYCPLSSEEQYKKKEIVTIASGKRSEEQPVLEGGSQIIMIKRIGSYHFYMTSSFQVI